MEQIYKIFLGTDYFLKLENIKEESSVIVDQNATVNMYFNLVLTACRTLEVCVPKTCQLLYFVYYILYRSVWVCNYEG